MPMSQDHKEALARGRLEARAIKGYLEALEQRRPGRPVTRESLEKRLSQTTKKIESEEDALRRVELTQKRLDIEDELSKLGESANFEELEADFVEHVKSYSERKAISYTAWREVGVPAAALRAAGVPETRRR